jgi:hypothetical protein
MIAKLRNGVLLILLVAVAAQIVWSALSSFIPVLLVIVLLLLGLGAIVRKLF